MKSFAITSSARCFCCNVSCIESAASAPRSYTPLQCRLPISSMTITATFSGIVDGTKVAIEIKINFIMDEPSRAEFVSIEKSLAHMSANGGQSYTRLYRSHRVAMKIAAHVHTLYNQEYAVFVVRLRNGQAVLVVDMCCDSLLEDVEVKPLFAPAKSARVRRGK